MKDAIWFEVPEAMQNFTGRHAELDSIHASIMNSNGQGTTVITVISGLGGMGKTTLAVKYAWEYHNIFQNVIWINAESTTAMKDSFMKLAEQLEISSNLKDDQLRKIVAGVYNFFRNKTALFIFDNVESESKTRKNSKNLFFPPQTSPRTKNPFILFTTRDNDWNEKFNVIHLQEFTESESMDFLKNYLQLKGNSEMEVAKKLAETLQRLPLAMRQGAAYIKSQKNITKYTNQALIQEYLSEFEKNSKSLLSYEYWTKTGDGFRQTTFVTWNLTFQKIKQNPLASQIIKLISLWGSDHIPVQVFDALIPEEIGLFKRFLSMFSRNNRLDLSQGIRSAIHLLAQYSIVSLTEGGGELNIHRIVQTVVRDKMNLQEKQKKLRESIQLFKALLELGNEHKNLCFVHAESVLAQSEGILPNSEIQSFSVFVADHRDFSIQTEIDVGDILFSKGEYHQAIEKYLTVHKILLKNATDLRSRAVANLYTTMQMGHAYKLIGNYELALEQYNFVCSAPSQYAQFDRIMQNNYFTKEDVEQMFLWRRDCLDKLGRENEMPTYLKEGLECIQSYPVIGATTLEILHISAFFISGQVEPRWFSENYDNVESSFSLLQNCLLVEPLQRGIQVNLLIRIWIKLFSSKEDKRKYLEKGKTIAEGLPEGDGQAQRIHFRDEQIYYENLTELHNQNLLLLSYSNI